MCLNRVFNWDCFCVLSANFSSSSYIRMSVSSEHGTRADDKEANEDDNLTMETGALGNVR